MACRPGAGFGPRTASARCPSAAAGLARGVEDVHGAEERGRAAVGHGGDLARLGLAAVEGAAQDVGLRPADLLHGPPEVGGRGLVGEVLDLAGETAVLDEEGPLTGELEVVALHVDRPGPVADHVEAALDPADQ